MAIKLPDCDELFLKFFDPWYSPDDRKRKGFPGTRPDLMEAKPYVGRAAASISPLTPEGQVKVHQMIDGMLDAARNDWPSYLDLHGDPDLRWIDAFDKYYDGARVRELIDSADAKHFSNAVLVTSCEFGAVLGHVLRNSRPSLEWVFDWPYWESSLFDLPSGNVLAVFHWAIKKMSSYGIDDGFKAKSLACLQYLKEGRSLS